MAEKYELEDEKTYIDEKRFDDVSVNDLSEETEPENSKIEAVRVAVPVTDDPTLPVLTFRFWVLSFIFSVVGSVIWQYYYFRSTSGTFSIYFVILVTYPLGKLMAKILPTYSVSVFGFGMSLNPGPFNIKEHALIGITVSTAAQSAYAIDILAATDLFLHYRVAPLGAILLIITTQCLGYGMAGSMRKYLVYPANMIWWGNLVQVVFFNAMHNTDEFKSKRMVRGWSYMTFFWVVAGICFVYEFIPQLLAPMFVYFDWLCWINPFNRTFWALFSSYSGAGILSISFDWTSITGQTLYLPFYSQVNNYLGIISYYWILFPILWMSNTLGVRDYSKPFTSHLYYTNGSTFDVVPLLNPDYSLNETLYEEGGPAVMTPMYALAFMTGFISLAACVTHIICFHGREILDTWTAAISEKDEDIHNKLMQVYPEVPQLWYGIFYIFMVALSIFVIEVYHLELPWWGLLVGAALGWVLTLPICAMQAITGFAPGLNVITELICGYMLPGKPIANMVFKCYGYMAMYQCSILLSDLKLGIYMKIPPRAMFIGQIWGAIVGAVFNYITMIIIINAHRDYLDGTVQDPSGLWTGNGSQIYWGSALIYGALGPNRMFSSKGPYSFVFYGFLIGAIIPIIQWGLSKKFPKVQWSMFNVSIFTQNIGSYVGGFITGITSCIVTIVIFGFYIFRYHKAWWSKYTFITAVALDTGAAFTGLVIFLFLGGGISPKLAVTAPTWWANYVMPDGSNGPYLANDRCGDSSGNWTGGLL
ncbi:hypothetical protein BGZ49_001266 [Haplosporangium sp. Z 27]|nr:hypothetical protein BGZ49_001266 [Haplosporangium sp. Z 27]